MLNGHYISSRLKEFGFYLIKRVWILFELSKKKIPEVKKKSQKPKKILKVKKNPKSPKKSQKSKKKSQK